MVKLFTLCDPISTQRSYFSNFYLSHSGDGNIDKNCCFIGLKLRKNKKCSNIFPCRQIPIKKIFLCIVFLFLCVSAEIDILYRRENICSEKEFFLPYVKLLKTRQPNHENFPIAKLLTPGYISLTKYTGILCINGPAIVYTDVNQDPKCGNEWLPSYGEPQLFSHDCFSINRLARDAYKNSEEKELTKETLVYGNKVFGVYLLGNSPDYRVANFLFLPGENFGYNPDNSWCVHNGGSVAFVTDSTESSTHCYNVKKYNMEGTISAADAGASFCYREDRDEDFDTPWRKDETPLTNEDIAWDEEGMPCSPPLNASSKDLESEPLQLPDFRIIHPKYWKSQGSQGILYKSKKKLGGDMEEIPIYSKPYPPGSLFPGEPGWKDPSELSHVAPAGDITDDEDADATTSEPLKHFEVMLSGSDCEEVPKLPESCGPEDLGDPCMLIYHVLTLEETDWKGDNLKDGSWRLPILELINSIYERVCPQVAKFLAAALSRVFQLFLNKAIEANSTMKEKFNQPHKHEWSDMIMDLERCNEKAEMMTFFKKQNAPAAKFRAKLETKLSHLYESYYSKREALRIEEQSRNNNAEGDLDLSTFTEEKKDDTFEELQEIEKIKSHLNEIPLKFPYKIYVGTGGSSDFSKAAQVFQYREAAEIDHELDWALDSYWKVVATVLGYCNMHYASRDSSTFMRLYDSFTQDFFEYVAEFWAKGENRLIYDQLFGEFIYGPGTLWIDACQNGAYQWTDKTDLRPLRPLNLNEGDVPPGPITDDIGRHPTPTNFFVDNPVFSKMTTDHYDYEDDDASGDNNGGEESIAEPFLSNYNRHNSVKTALRDNIVDPLHNFI